MQQKKSSSMNLVKKSKTQRPASIPTRLTSLVARSLCFRRMNDEGRQLKVGKSREDERGGVSIEETKRERESSDDVRRERRDLTKPRLLRCELPTKLGSGEEKTEESVSSAPPGKLGQEASKNDSLENRKKPLDASVVNPVLHQLGLKQKRLCLFQSSF